MPNYTRTQCPGGTLFFTLVTFERRPFLTTNISRKLLKRAWQEVQSKWPFNVDAICLLPNHLHCVITLPENDGDYALRWRAIKSHVGCPGCVIYKKQLRVACAPQSIPNQVGHKVGGML